MEISFRISGNDIKVLKDNKDFVFSTVELENLLEAFLNGDVDFKDLSDENYTKFKDQPYVALIYGIKDSSKEGSEFKKKLEELEKEKQDIADKLAGTE